MPSICKLTFAGAVLFAALGAEAAPPTGSGQDTVLLDETAYWRYCLQGGPVRISYEAMKTDANELFSKSQLKRHERRVVRDLKKKGRKTADWRASTKTSTPACP